MEASSRNKMIKSQPHPNPDPPPKLEFIIFMCCYVLVYIHVPTDYRIIMFFYLRKSQTGRHL